MLQFPQFLLVLISLNFYYPSQLPKYHLQFVFQFIPYLKVGKVTWKTEDQLPTSTHILSLVSFMIPVSFQNHWPIPWFSNMTNGRSTFLRSPSKEHDHLLLQHGVNIGVFIFKLLTINISLSKISFIFVISQFIHNLVNPYILTRALGFILSFMFLYLINLCWKNYYIDKLTLYV